MQNLDKLKIAVSSNTPTDKALKNFHDQLYELMSNADKKKVEFNSGYKAVKS